MAPSFSNITVSHALHLFHIIYKYHIFLPVKCLSAPSSHSRPLPRPLGWLNGPMLKDQLKIVWCCYFYQLVSRQKCKTLYQFSSLFSSGIKYLFRRSNNFFHISPSKWMIIILIIYSFLYESKLLFFLNLLLLIWLNIVFRIFINSFHTEHFHTGILNFIGYFHFIIW